MKTLFLEETLNDLLKNYKTIIDAENEEIIMFRIFRNGRFVRVVGKKNDGFYIYID